jgi:hypothetical protein
MTSPTFTARRAALAFGRAFGLALALGATLPAQAAASYTADYAAFVAANPGLSLEGFEAASLPSGTDTAVAGPLNATTNNGVFASGSVLPGFSIEGVGGGELYVSRDLGGNTGANVSTNVFTENLFIRFAAGVTAVGLDLMQWYGNDGGWGVEAYDAADNLLVSFSTGEGGFIGITATEGIARLLLDKPDSGAVIDNLRFGTAGGTVAAPSSLALAGLGLLALHAGAQRRRRAGAATA